MPKCDVHPLTYIEPPNVLQRTMWLELLAPQCCYKEDKTIYMKSSANIQVHLIKC